MDKRLTNKGLFFQVNQISKLKLWHLVTLLVILGEMLIHEVRTANKATLNGGQNSHWF